MRTKQKKRILAIVIILLILAIAFTYVLPLTALGTTEFSAYGIDDPSAGAPPSDGQGQNPAPVEEEPDPPVLKILDSFVRLDVGAEHRLTCETQNMPAGTLLDWKSSDPRIAAIGGDGTIVAYAPGVVDIEVRAEGFPNVRSTVLVTVNELKANRITIVVPNDVAKTGDKSYEVKVGDVFRLSQKIDPEGSKVDKISWMIGNEQVASLSQSGATREFVALAKGQTQITVQADALYDSIVVSIVESGVPLDLLMKNIRYIAIVVVAIIVVAVVLTQIALKRKEEKARRKAVAAKRRKEEAERRAREEAETAERERQTQDQRLAQAGERMTMKVSGAAVGAGADAPRGVDANEPERPITLDDLE